MTEMNKKQLTEQKFLSAIKYQIYNSIFLAELGKKNNLDKLDIQALLYGISAILDKILLDVIEMEKTK